MFSIEFKLILRNILTPTLFLQRSFSLSLLLSLSLALLICLFDHNSLSIAIHLVIHAFSQCYCCVCVLILFVFLRAACCCFFFSSSISPTSSSSVFLASSFSHLPSPTLVCDQWFDGRFLFLLVAIVAWLQLFQEQSRIRLILMGFLLQHCPVIDIIILMVQRSEQNAAKI